MFLTPDDLTPFFGGTYFPPSARHGLPAFRDLLLRVVDFLGAHGDEIAKQNQSLRDALARAEPSAAGAADIMTAEPLERAMAGLRHAFDARGRGSGRAQVPHPTNIERCLRRHRDARDLHLGVHTLAKMALGGIYDHLGGGFCRYSVDGEWMIRTSRRCCTTTGRFSPFAPRRPGWSRERRPLRADRPRDPAVGDPRDAGPRRGLLLCARRGFRGRGGPVLPLDAGHGPRALDEEFAAVAASFGLDRPPNFEGRNGTPYLRRARGPRGEARGRRRGGGGAARPGPGQALRCASAEVRPGLDDKVLTSWNALMVSGLSVAGETLGSPGFVDAAVRAFDFLRADAWVDGRLYAAWKGGRARFPAYLDDHAFLLEAALRLLQARWRPDRLDFAIEIADALLGRFEDRERGGFWFTAHDHEALMHRSKSFSDDSLAPGTASPPPGSADSAHLLGDTRYLDAAERTLRAGWSGLVEMPHAHGAMLTALEEYLEPPQIIVLRGRGEALERWRMRCAAPYAPRRYVVAVPDDATGLPGMLEARAPRPGARPLPTSARATVATPRSPPSMISRRPCAPSRRGRSPGRLRLVTPVAAPAAHGAEYSEYANRFRARPNAKAPPGTAGRFSSTRQPRPDDCRGRRCSIPSRVAGGVTAAARGCSRSSRPRLRPC